MKEYNPQDFDSKWQNDWQDKNLYKAEDFSDKAKRYVLIEFPYPSGDGLHVGHCLSYVAQDTVARYLRLQGFNVLYPMGWDAFGLPAENYAIKHKIHPAEAVTKNIANFKRQLKSLGISFDWDREVNTTDPKYYKWTQWIFLLLFKAGLAEKKAVPINWCPSCKIGLAFEEVVDGKCERCGAEVEQRTIAQWVLKITKYADRLIDDLEIVDYLPHIKKQQIDWIGRSEGMEIDFELRSTEGRMGGRTEERKNGWAEERVILMHGKDKDPGDTWYPWFGNEVRKIGLEFTAPILPKKENPILAEWLAELDKIEPDADSILVGHSRGGVAIMRWLEKADADVKVKKVILVATNSGDDPEKDNDFYATGQYDFAKIKKHCDDFVVIHSRDDEWVPFESGQKIATGLQAKFIALDKRGHFGHLVSDLPELLDEIQATVDREPYTVDRQPYTVGRQPYTVDRTTDNGLRITVFTTRPDTIYGATFLVLAPDHPLVHSLESQITNLVEVKNYVEQAAKLTDREKQEKKEKTGVQLRGIEAVHPVTHNSLPIFIADYVMMSYGTGAIMAVPAHDERDWEFAKKYGLEIIDVMSGSNGYEAYVGEGTMINSDKYNGLKSEEAWKKMADDFEKRGIGQRVVKYKLRDWIFSRQHYWGEPIPIIHCQQCGIVPLELKDLPLELPEVKYYQPTDTGESPLAEISAWVNVKCPRCQGPAKRETDTMPNWAGSSWYFLRYCDPHNDQELAAKHKLAYWLPVDLYNGGMEHTTLHLLYSRFWHKFLYDQKIVPTLEPYARRVSHGMILGPDGVKMSKSKGNVITPDEIVQKYGADTLRLYELFMGQYEDTKNWSDESLQGVYRFLNRIWSYFQRVKPLPITEDGAKVALHESIKKITTDMERRSFNTTVSQLMILFNNIQEQSEISKKTLETFVILLAPSAPHTAEELWQMLGHETSVHQASWPTFDQNLLAAQAVTIGIQINGKLRAEITVASDISEDDLKTRVLALSQVQHYLNGQAVKKFIYIKNKIISIVI